MMNHRVKRKIVLILCLCTLFLTGCWDQKIFERIGFALQIGMEIDKSGELLLSITMPVVSEEIEEKVEVVSTTGDLVRESREIIRNSSGKRVEGGKAQHIHFAKELAEKGIGTLLDVFLRNPENPLLANIVVVDGSPLEMFHFGLEFKDKTRVAFYVSDLMEDARNRTAAPETRIWKFITLVHSKTIDPVVTFMKYSKKDIKIAGSALFNGDKMVGDIDTVQTGLLHALMAEKINFEYIYREEDPHDPAQVKSGAAILLKGVKRKVKIDISENKPQINISLDFKATLDEYDMKHDLKEQEAEKKLEQDASKSIKKDCMELIKYLQEIGSDPLGLGEMVRVKYNTFYKSIDWDKIYKDVVINVDVNLNIEFYGAVN